MSKPAAPDNERGLLRLAGDIVEGREVDWASVSADPDLSGWAGELRSIEALAVAMRRPPPPAAPVRELAVGAQLGRFRVEDVAQRGGMGVVHRGLDLVLDRPVALKLLPLEVAYAPERLARLAQEAKVLASLNHPHIATIYGMEEVAGGLPVLVLEWIAGESLATRLARGPLSVREALEVCLQIARGVAASHAGGVIHRDLKPGNVMFTSDGRVKVVDFGLARRSVHPRDSGASKAEVSIAGTWGYLSPERLSGREDHRVDLFAFGCVLYECLTGVPAFSGATAEAIHRALLEDEPDASRLPDGCPLAVRRLITACVEKNPERRLSTMAEVAEILEASLGRRTAEPSGLSTRLPLPASSFVGRTQEQEICRRALSTGRLLTITGAGGVGKTRLALAVARALEPELPGGAWFVDLVAVQDPSQVADLVCSTVGAPDDVPLPILDRIARHLRSTEALILLDNCERVTEACADLVRALHSGCTGMRVLATSRAPLRVEEEQVLKLKPLPVPATGAIDNPAALLRCDSVNLFLERATEAAIGFSADAETLEHVAQICLEVEGIPLAIELAAARVRVLGVRDIALRLDRQLQLLRDTTERLDPRHRALEATIDWAVAQLRPEELPLFRALGVFSGGWTLEAGTAVCRTDDEFATLDLLSTLVDKSLVATVPQEAGPPRYRFLEPVRQYALEKLEASPDATAVKRRHAAHFLALAEDIERVLYGPDQRTGFERLSTEHSNLLTALEWSHLDPDGIESELRLAAALGRYWHVRGFVELGTRQLDRALGRAGGESVAPARATALAMAGAFAYWRNDLPTAVSLLEESCGLFRGLGDRRGEAKALLVLGPAHGTLGNLDLGYSLCESGMESFRALGDRRGVATMLLNLGVLTYARGEVAAAHALFREATDLHRESGDRITLALTLGNQSALSVQLGAHDAARSELTEALELSTSLGTTWAGTSAIATAATLALVRGDPANAAWMFGAVTAGAESSGLLLNPAQRQQLDPLIAQAREQLEPAAFDAAWQSGRSLRFPEAAAKVLAWLATPSG